MRNAFADELTKIAAENPKVVLLSGDIGNRLFDPYKRSFPDRFFNCGVAEANMIGVGAGMAMTGMRPVAYTIASFITFRCYEQIKIDLCYHNLPLIIVGVGGGLSYASLGATHHSCEDIAILRALPNMTVLCPGDALEVRSLLREALKEQGPVYLRLGKKNEPTCHSEVPQLTIGKSYTVKEGDAICIISTGNTLPISVDAAGILDSKGISTRVESFHTVKPLDRALLKEVFFSYKVVASVEEHSVLGGLGGSIAEWLSEQKLEGRAQFLRFGTPDRFLHKAGDQAFAREQFCLTPEYIAGSIIKAAT
ncbi:MAG: transketolase [Candidatus Dadabacteria bacterium]|nr:MAG: transketolase [Candidatus Dadabacteria bacterium]